MNRKSNTERIEQLKENIKKSQTIIAKENEKIKKTQAEIKTIEELEIKGIINEMNIPYNELKEFLKTYKRR